MIFKLSSHKRINFLDNSIMMYIIFFAFSTSVFFQAFPIINNILNVLRILFFILLVYNYAFNYKLPKIFYCILFFNLAYLLSKLYNGTLTISFWFFFINSLGSILFVSAGIKEFRNKFIKCGRNMYFILLLLNIIFVIFFPGIQMDVGIVYLLGIRINFTIYVFVAILFTLLYDKYIFQVKISKFTIILIIVGILNILIPMVATGLIGISFTLIFSVIFYLKKPNKYLYYFIIPITMFFLIVIITDANISFLTNILDVFGKDLTFNNRTYIWKDAVKLITRQPIVGYGVSDLYVNAFASYHPAHNEILNVLYSGGILALIPFLESFLCVIKNNNGKKDFINYIYISLLLSIALMMITEIQSTYTGFYYILGIGYFLGNDLDIYNKEKEYENS